jgi:hypothetical protein
LLKPQQPLDRHDPAATLALNQALIAIFKELSLQEWTIQVDTLAVFCKSSRNYFRLKQFTAGLHHPANRSEWVDRIDYGWGKHVG